MRGEERRGISFEFEKWVRVAERGKGRLGELEREWEEGKKKREEWRM